MFIFVNGGDEQSPYPRDVYGAHRLLAHRAFLFGLFGSGLVLALLQGAEFRESKASDALWKSSYPTLMLLKVLTFVYESKMNARRSGDVLPPPIRAASSAALLALKNIESKTSPSIHSILSDQRQLAPFDCIAVLREVTQALKLKRTKTDTGLLFAFIIHVLLLSNISVHDRARRLESITDDLKTGLMAFLSPIFLTAESVIAASNTTIDVDVRVFLSLVRFFTDNTGLTLQQAIGTDLAKIMETEFKVFIVPIAKFAQYSHQFLPRSTPPPPTPNIRLLPFSNPVFDEELAPLHGVVSRTVADKEDKQESSEESAAEDWDASSGDEDEGSADESVEEEIPEEQGPGFFDDGILYRDAYHWHNFKKTILPKHSGGDAQASMTEWQRKKKLRSDQRFMKSLHNQAATLTGTPGAALQQIKILPVGSTPPPPLKVILL